MMTPMSHEHILWIAAAAYALHILEEHQLNWRDWAQVVLRLPVDWTTFYLVNALVLVLGAICAAVGWREPWFALCYPAVMLINATLFHVLPTIARRVYSPGVATAVLLFYPVAAWTYYGAYADGALTPITVLISTLLGAALMATPVALLKIKGRPMFDYATLSDRLNS